jgi:thiosulfate/3-mercaptopyruvate sulfurtransferase
MTQTISTDELVRRQGESDLVIVDIRSMAAYNGWRLHDEVRGGHIRGAVACPETYTVKLSADDMMQLLESKGITPEKTVVIYGYSNGHSAEVAETLAEMGFADVLVYVAGLEAWAADPDLSMERLARFEKLVYPYWVHELLDGGKPESYSGGAFAVFHVTFGVPEEYEAGHIPGAYHLDTNLLESDVDWNRRSPEELEETLLSHGISHDTTVVIYGRDSNPTMALEHPGKRAGQIAATRAAAILMYAGVEDVRLLDGGLDAWLSAGYPLETETNKSTPVEEFGVQIPAHPDYIVDIDEARALIADPGGVLVSIRSWKEFIGDVSGYHYIGPRGRIAGAVWGNCGTDAYHMQNYRNGDNTMREFYEIEANWREMGITPEKQVAFYCGTGWRASETFFYAYLMGWNHVAVYDGGWLEWSSDPSNPIESGVPS